MNFNPDITEMAQEVIFSGKRQNTSYSCLIFDHKTARLTESQKHFGILDWILRSIWNSFQKS